MAACPCAGDISEEDYAAIVATAERGLSGNPELLLDPLADRMTRLADEERFEEAVETRDRADALATALNRRDRIDGLRRSGRLRLVVDGSSVAEFLDGELQGTHPGDPVTEEPLPHQPVAKERADELHCVAAWLQRDAHRIVIEHCDGVLAEPVRRPPSFRASPRARPGSGAGR